MTSTAGGDKRTDWEEDRKQNRKDTIKRERMWQTVGMKLTFIDDLFHLHLLNIELYDI